MRDRAGFFGKKKIFKKIMSLVLSGICVKRKFYGSLTFCENCMLGKNLVLKVNQKRLSDNEISVFFNRQYFTNRLISDFDFWHVDRHE